jgi:hypothetical protein
MADIVISVLVLASLAFTVTSMYKKRKMGISSCGDCNRCKGNNCGSGVTSKYT